MEKIKAMLAFWWFAFSLAALATPCKPNEIYIRQQSIDHYEKSDGTDVSAHTRKAHCRQILRENHFKDETSQDFKNLKSTLKPWNAGERKIVEAQLASRPNWLAKYIFKEILRADQGGHPLNPAATIPSTKTLLIFDQFFKDRNQRAIIIHETSHLAIYDFTENEVKTFAQASGWRVKNRNYRTAPEKLLKPDSQNSISEDFANHIEQYYVNRRKLMLHNSMSFLVIEQLIDSKER